MWSTTKPTGPCACAYEHTDGVYYGGTYEANGNLFFIGINPKLSGAPSVSVTITRNIQELNGRFLSLDIPDPPQRMTPGDKLRELYQQFAHYDTVADKLLEAARRGELLVEE